MAIPPGVVPIDVTLTPPLGGHYDEMGRELSALLGGKADALSFARAEAAVRRFVEATHAATGRVLPWSVWASPLRDALEVVLGNGSGAGVTIAELMAKGYVDTWTGRGYR